MKKICITTFWDTPVNYGQVLQGFALINVLKKLGYSPFILKYTMNEEVIAESKFAKILKILSGKSSLTRYLKKFYYTSEKNVDRGFNEFKNKYMVYSDSNYPSFKSLEENYPKADIYITGSDQVWGEWGSENKKKVFLLDFLPSSVKRISYAASFGRNYIKYNELNLFKNTLDKFDAISVREKSGISICKSLGYDAQLVADPTLLLDRETWIKTLNLNCYKENDKTAFVYLMQNEYTTQLGHKIIKYLKRKGYSIKYVSSAYYIDPQSNYNATIEQWLIGILTADIVVTSSFHGTLFSTNFNTPIISLCGRGGKEGQNSRIYSLLDEIGLSNRILDEFDENKLYLMLQENINWEKTNKIFNEKRNSSLSFIKKSLEK